MTAPTLVCGTDRAAIIDERNRRTRLAAGQGGDVARIDLTDPDGVEALLVATTELSLLATSRLIVAEGAEQLDAKDISTRVREALAASHPDVAILLVGVDGAKARVPKALKTAVQDAGGDVHVIQALKPREAAAAAKNIAMDVASLAISHDDAQQLAEGCAHSRARIRTRCEQLQAFTDLGAAAIDTEMVELVAGESDRELWPALDALTSGDAATLLRDHADLVHRGKDNGLLVLAIRRIRDMATVRVHLEAGRTLNEAAQLLGGHPYAAEQRARAAARLTGPQISKALSCLAAGEHAARGGTRLDPQTATVIALRDAAAALT